MPNIVQAQQGVPMLVHQILLIFAECESANVPTIQKKTMRLQMHETTSLIYLLEDSI